MKEFISHTPMTETLHSTFVLGKEMSGKEMLSSLKRKTENVKDCIKSGREASELGGFHPACPFLPATFSLACSWMLIIPEHFGPSMD
jgi:hypothetical protein